MKPNLRRLFGLLPTQDDRFGVGLVDARPGHAEFRARELERAERVVWNVPEVSPDWKYRGIALEEAARICRDDPNHGVSVEVQRIYKAYVADFMRCLEQHEKRYNRGGMPQVMVPARHGPALFAVQHLAELQLRHMLYEVIVDATEEDPLLNPAKA